MYMLFALHQDDPEGSLLRQMFAHASTPALPLFDYISAGRLGIYTEDWETFSSEKLQNARSAPSCAMIVVTCARRGILQSMDLCPSPADVRAGALHWLLRAQGYAGSH